jgi:hypothetical protein
MFKNRRQNSVEVPLISLVEFGTSVAGDIERLDVVVIDELTKTFYVRVHDERLFVIDTARFCCL